MGDVGVDEVAIGFGARLFFGLVIENALVSGGFFFGFSSGLAVFSVLSACVALPRNILSKRKITKMNFHQFINASQMNRQLLAIYQTRNALATLHYQTTQEMKYTQEKQKTILSKRSATMSRTT